MPVLPLPRELWHRRQDEEERHQRLPAGEDDDQPDGDEEPEEGAAAEEDDVQPAPGRLVAGALEVVGEARVLEPDDPLPAVGGAQQLLDGVARDAVNDQALDRLGGRLDQLAEGERGGGQADPDRE